MFEFNRGINDKFVARLNEEYERTGWWRALATDLDLFIAIRDGYLNVYWKGTSLLKLRFDGERLLGEIHYKYLLLPSLPKLYVPVVDGQVELPDPGAWFQRDLSDVAALKRAAAAYVGEEKKGVHSIIQSNANILDVEVAFGTSSNSAGGHCRLDFASLQATAEGADVVLFEAKHFSNNEVRAAGDAEPRVVGQIQHYQALIAQHRQAIEDSYRAVCGNLADLRGVCDRYGASLDLMRRLAAREAPLRVDDAVWLALFGFDSAQIKSEGWEKHYKKLEAALNGRVLLKGDPKGFTSGISKRV